MLCPHCDIDLATGLAIKPNPEDVRGAPGFNPVVTHKNLEFVECLKCPKCGYSDDGVKGDRLFMPSH